MGFIPFIKGDDNSDRARYDHRSGMLTHQQDPDRGGVCAIHGYMGPFVTGRDLFWVWRAPHYEISITGLVQQCMHKADLVLDPS